jgi:hypothetical protein
MTLYKLFERIQIRWNLYELNYSQLIFLLQELGYLHPEGNTKMTENVS